MGKNKEKTYYIVNYRNPKDGAISTIKANAITDSSLGLSFVAISDFVFESSGVLVNPEEEAKKIEFENVKTLHLSIHSILSVTEVGEDAKGLKFKNDKANLLMLHTETHETPTN